MLNFVSWELVFFGFAIFGVTVLTNLSSRLLAENRKKFYLMKKIAWGLLIISTAYFTITFPYAGSYYNFSSKSEYPTELNSESEAKCIKEHHQRIEALEREVKDAWDEVRAIRERLSAIFQILMFGMVFYGCNQIFNSKLLISKNKNSGEIDN